MPFNCWFVFTPLPAPGGLKKKMKILGSRNLFHLDFTSARKVPKQQHDPLKARREHPGVIYWLYLLANCSQFCVLVRHVSGLPSLMTHRGLPETADPEHPGETILLVYSTILVPLTSIQGSKKLQNFFFFWLHIWSMLTEWKIHKRWATCT